MKIGGESDPVIREVKQFLQSVRSPDQVQDIMRNLLYGAPEELANPQILKDCLESYARLREMPKVPAQEDIQYVFESIIRPEKMDSDLFNRMLRFYVDCGKYEKIEKLLQKAILQRKTNPDLYRIAFEGYRKQMAKVEKENPDDPVDSVFTLLWPNSECNDPHFYEASMNDAYERGDLDRTRTIYETIPEKLFPEVGICHELALRVAEDYRFAFSCFDRLTECRVSDARKQEAARYLTEISTSVFRAKPETLLRLCSILCDRSLPIDFYTAKSGFTAAIALSNTNAALRIYRMMCNTGQHPPPEITNALLDLCITNGKILEGKMVLSLFKQFDLLPDHRTGKLAKILSNCR